MRRLGTMLLAVFTVAAVPTAGQASFVGDLVFCDANDNGVYDPGEVGLDDVRIDVECSAANGQTCFDVSTVTGTIHPTAQTEIGLFDFLCAPVTTWDPADTSAQNLQGRYLVEVFNDCFAFPFPWTCTVTIDENDPDIPADCNVLATPIEGVRPMDGNGDGDLCDAADGPFPEGQTLGNNGQGTTCEAFPDPPPASGQYTAILSPMSRDD